MRCLFISLLMHKAHCLTTFVRRVSGGIVEALVLFVTSICWIIESATSAIECDSIHAYVPWGSVFVRWMFLRSSMICPARIGIGACRMYVDRSSNLYERKDLGWFIFIEHRCRFEFCFLEFEWIQSFCQSLSFRSVQNGFDLWQRKIDADSVTN